MIGILSEPIAGWTLVAKNTTEQTMTSATAADLVTLTGFSIPVNCPVMLVVSFRKAATGSQLWAGLKLNSTVVAEANVDSSFGIGSTGTTNEATAGVTVVTFGPRSTDYLLGGLVVTSAASGATGVTVFTRGGQPLNNAFPNVAITTIIIRGDSDGSALFAVKDVYVYQGRVA